MGGFVRGKFKDRGPFITSASKIIALNGLEYFNFLGH
ncbi:hypothetical protein ABSA28_00725 [Candidatus Hepatincolaceae symbiont of Richtersius coronifer]